MFFSWSWSSVINTWEETPKKRGSLWWAKIQRYWSPVLDCHVFKYTCPNNSQEIPVQTIYSKLCDQLEQMGLHSDFSWCTQEHYSCFSWAQSPSCCSALLIWLPGGSRKFFFLRRNPSLSHFKTKHSLVSRSRKYLCTVFWWLFKRNSQNFDHCYFLPTLNKQTIRFTFRQH